MADLASILKQKFFHDVMADLLQRNQGARAISGGLSEDLVDEALRERLLPRLGELPGLTAEDLLDAWRRLSKREPGAVPDVCDEFAKLLVAEASHNWLSNPIAVGPPCHWAYGIRNEPDQVWGLRDGTFAAFIVGEMPAGGRLSPQLDFPQNNEHGCRLQLTIKGKCTKRFFDELCGVAASAVSTILCAIRDLHSQATMECLELLANRQESVEGATEKLEKLKGILNLRRPGPCVTLSQDEDGTFSLVEEPGPDIAYKSRHFLEHALDAMFLDVPGKKDSMARRVKNAVRLIGESDNQRHNPIGLALSVTAIEALLCRKGDSLAQMFAENMAFLLEPDPTHRLQAEQWGKRIYDLRSGILHGSDLDCSARDINQAKLAVGMVLRAVLERRAAIKRVGGEDENPEEFLKELRSGKYRPGQLTHVSELPLKRFWRSDSPTRSA